MIRQGSQVDLYGPRYRGSETRAMPLIHECAAIVLYVHMIAAIWFMNTWSTFGLAWSLSFVSVCVCLCVRVCVWVCACVCVCECPWLQRAKDHLKDLPIMDHVFVKQSCGNYVSIAYVGKTVASSGEGRARCWKYFKIKASDRIWKIQFTEKRLPESSTPQHMRYLNKTPRISLPLELWSF